MSNEYDSLSTRAAQRAPAVLSTDWEAERAVGRLHSALAYQRVEEMFETDLHAYLLDIQRQCNQIGEHIQAQYFAPRILRPEEVIA